MMRHYPAPILYGVLGLFVVAIGYTIWDHDYGNTLFYIATGILFAFVLQSFAVLADETAALRADTDGLLDREDAKQPGGIHRPPVKPIVIDPFHPKRSGC